MSKQRKDPLIEALQAGKSYTWTIPGGGDLASMRAVMKVKSALGWPPRSSHYLRPIHR